MYRAPKSLEPDGSGEARIETRDVPLGESITSSEPAAFASPRKRAVVEEGASMGLEASTVAVPTRARTRAGEQLVARPADGPQSLPSVSVARSSSSGSRLPGQQQPRWSGSGPLPVADLELQVRRELDELEKRKYSDNRYLAKISADWSNSKRDEIRRQIWAKYMERRG